MNKFNLIISVLVLYNIGNIYCRSKTCKDADDCMTIPLCSEAAKLATFRRVNETVNKKFTSAICGMTWVNNRPAVQICCSEFEVEKAEYISSPSLSQRTANGVNSQPETEDSDLSSHSNVNLLPKDCGKYLEDRIVGGEFAHIYEFPWMALISLIETFANGKTNVDFACGGTIINSKYILTAAHCVQDKVVRGVRVGEFDLRIDVDCEGEYPRQVCEGHLQDLSVETPIVHEGYRTSPELVNDIALLRVKGEINFSHRNVRPICLPVYEQLIKSKLNGEMVIIAGWGITETGSRSMLLKKVSVRVWSDAKPNENKKVILAGNAGSDSCQGDSGGPLMFHGIYGSSERMIQYGVVSNGPVLCGSSSPAKYTDVRKYMRWILDNIKE